jgi:hypothetical protein
MILEGISQYESSKPYYRTVTSEMYALLPRNLNQTTVGIILRTLLHGEPPPDMAGTKEYVNEALSIAMHAIKAAIHFTLESSLGSLTFNRDMFLS